MPARLYRLTVLGAALTWAMFGMYAGIVLQDVEADIAEPT